MAWVRIPPLSIVLSKFAYVIKMIFVRSKLGVLSGSVAEWSKALVLGTSHFGGWVRIPPLSIKTSFNIPVLILVDRNTFDFKDSNTLVIPSGSVAERSKALV